jgi:hypothetical protein
MNRLLLAAAVSSLIAIATPAQAACNASTVKGAFGFGATDEDYDMKTPSFIIGRVIFDGVNKVTLSNGKVSDYGQATSFTGSGSYTLSANCAGSSSVTLNDGSRVRFDFIATGTPSDIELYLLISSATEGFSGQGSARKITF